MFISNLSSNTDMAWYCNKSGRTGIDALIPFKDTTFQVPTTQIQRVCKIDFLRKHCKLTIRGYLNCVQQTNKK